LATQKDITQLLLSINAGNAEAEENLLIILYDELHAMAQYYMRGENAGHTLQTTALVHEAFLRLSGNAGITINDKAHYMRLAARAMRRVLIDHARSRQTQKKGGGHPKEPLEIANAYVANESVDLLDLDQALKKLSEIDPALTQLVELRFFGGLTVEETAQVLEVSPRTVKTHWKMAKVWLKNNMED
jgi:RNA polymerase sigma factor (TIGR02999 family)